MQLRARRSFRRNLLLLAASANLIAGATVAAAASGPGQRAATSVQVLDIGLVRLHVPSSWVVDVGQKICAHGSCRRQCAPGYDKRVYLSRFAPMLNCPLNFRRNAVWVVPTSRKGATTRQTLAYDGGSVILSMPASGVTLYGFGKPGVRAVDTEEPSSLARLLGSHLTASVPTGWQRVSDGSMSMAIPANWPVHRLGHDSIAPGACGTPSFLRPAAFIGTPGVVAYCPHLTTAEVAEAATVPGNGAWLSTAERSGPGNNQPIATFDPPGLRAEELRINGLDVTLSFALAPNGTNTVWASALASGKRHTLVLGLGLQPTIAVAILSSLRAG